MAQQIHSFRFISIIPYYSDSERHSHYETHMPCVGHSHSRVIAQPLSWVSDNETDPMFATKLYSTKYRVMIVKESQHYGDRPSIGFDSNNLDLTYSNTTTITTVIANAHYYSDVRTRCELRLDSSVLRFHSLDAILCARL